MIRIAMHFTALHSEATTLASTSEYTLEVKRSKFYTWAWPVTSEDEVGRR